MSGKQKHYHQQAPSSFPRCEMQGADTVFSFGDAEPVIKDDANEKIKDAYSNPEIKSKQRKYYAEGGSGFIAGTENPDAVSEQPENRLTGFDRFYEEQKDRHRTAYFMFGLVILIILLLGIFSAVFLALTALKDINLPF